MWSERERNVAKKGSLELNNVMDASDVRGDASRTLAFYRTMDCSGCCRLRRSLSGTKNESRD